MIKKTSSADYGILENLEKECFSSEGWNLGQILSHHKIQNSFLYYDESILPNPVGYLVFMENSFELEILRIGVLPSLRRLGIGIKLIAFLETLAIGRDIVLEVKAENFPAIELYKKKGFINFAVRKRYYPDGNDAILMKKESKK